jgi:WD repeat-containing protein 22
MTRAQATMQQTAEFSGAFFHPLMEHLFATSDVRGNVRLRDTRMAFGPLRQRTKEGIVLKVICGTLLRLTFALLTTPIYHQYVTRITRRTVPTYIRPEASSITWDRDGEFR